MWHYNQEWGIIFHFYILSRFAVRKVFPSESYLFSQFLSVGILSWEKHSMFQKWWNTAKSISNIWQHFSCLLDKGTAKICKKFNSHDGFLRVNQEKEKLQPDGWNGCPILQAAQKATVRFQFLAYICNLLIK